MTHNGELAVPVLCRGACEFGYQGVTERRALPKSREAAAGFSSEIFHQGYLIFRKHRWEGNCERPAPRTGIQLLVTGSTLF